MNEMNSGQYPVHFLALPTHQLLTRFGSGGHKPGSGSAAALLSLVSSKLLQTVVSLSKNRDDYREVENQLTLVNQNIIDSIEPFLIEAVQRDAVQFDKVIALRRARDAETDPRRKRRLREKARMELRSATEIPLEIAQHSVKLAQQALTVFDLGFKSARGDSGVAVSAALSGATGALCIVFLNLASFGKSDWAIDMRIKANGLQASIQSLHVALLQRVNGLQSEAEARAERVEDSTQAVVK